MLILKVGELPDSVQQTVSAGFQRHSDQREAPVFKKERLCWTLHGPENQLHGAATADKLWDWVYIDELWVDEGVRGKGIGRQLLEAVEAYASEHHVVGVWLWTQSWQAEGFYRAAGYAEFARFSDFPRGHQRIGFRKILPSKEATAAQ